MQVICYIKYMILKIFLTGWVILVFAIFLNYLAGRFGITTWYPFLDEVGKVGLAKAFLGSSLFSKLFLFIAYPVLLGLSAYLVFKNLK